MTLTDIRPSILSLTPADSLALVIASRKVVIKQRPARLPGVAKVRSTKSKKPRAASAASMSREQLELLIQELEQQ